VLGGGRYDGLIETLGGAHTPAVGWAAGIERLAMLVADAGAVVADRLDVVIALESDDEFGFATAKLAELRRAGFAADIVATGSPRKRFDKAGKLGATFLVSIGQRDGVRSVNVRGEADGREQRVHAILAA
jgi:histidyl-tRNA synthetase